MNKIKTIFIGTGEFAVPLLRAALEHSDLNIELVVTQPDRPSGRKQELTPSPIKQNILDQKITVDVLQPEKIKEISQEILDKYQPELILVASYGQIIPNNILDYPKYKALNFHGSLLPKLRGAVPVPMAILQGLNETGVTLQIMTQKMDEGPIVALRKSELKGTETSETLMSELAELAVKMLEQDLIRYINGEIITIEQDHSLATYCYKTDLEKEKAEIIFGTSVDQAERMVRAFYPWPVAWIRLSDSKVLKLFKVKIIQSQEEIERYLLQDTVTDLRIFVKDKRLFLQLSNGSLELLEVQLEGKRRGIAMNYLFLVK